MPATVTLPSSSIQGFGSVVFAQIRYLVVNLNKRNQKMTVAEIAQLLELYGQDAFVHLMRCLLEEVDFRDARLQKDQLKVQLLTQEFPQLTLRPNFVSALGEVFSSVALPSQMSHEDFLQAVIKGVKATMPQQLALGFALAQHADETIRTMGETLLRSRLSELSKEQVAGLPEDLVHSLLFYMERGDESWGKPRLALAKTLLLLVPDEKMPLSMLWLLDSANGGVGASDLNCRLSFEAERDLAPEAQGPALTSAHTTQLADMMHDLGYSCCATSRCLAELLSQFGAGSLSAAAVAAAIGMMARTVSSIDDSLSLHGAFSVAVTGKYLEFDAKFDADKDDQDKGLSGWNVEAFVEAINEQLPQLSWGWPTVFEALDQPSLGGGVPAAGLHLIISVHKLACGGQPLSARALFGGWTNSAGQLSLLTHALTVEDGISWAAEPSIKPPPEGSVKPALACWLAQGLTESLLRLSDSGRYYAEVQQLFAKPLEAAPQALLTTLLHIAPAGSREETQLQRDLLEQLFALFISGDSPGSTALLQRLWALQPEALMRAMAQLHSSQPQSILRLLDLAQSFGALEQVLQMKIFSFTIDLATVAQRKDLIQLDGWLEASLQSDGEHAFVKACIHYLREKLLGTAGGPLMCSASAANVNVLSIDAAAVFFRILQSAELPETLAEELGHLYDQCVQAKPKLQTLYGGVSRQPTKNGMAAPAAAEPNLNAPAEPEPVAAPAPPPLSAPAGAPAAGAVERGAVSGQAGVLPGMPGGESMQFPQDIEEEANSYFQKIYTDTTSIDEVVEVLKRFQKSESPREQSIYVCMVHNLFDEYRYFPKYPDKPLRTTAVLFGALVQHQLVSNITLGMFLRYVLEALRKPPGSKMCTFGVTALMQFRPRLSEWPQYCQHLIGIPHIAQVLPDLVAELTVLAGGSQPMPVPAGAGFDSELSMDVSAPKGGAPAAPGIGGLLGAAGASPGLGNVPAPAAGGAPGGAPGGALLPPSVQGAGDAQGDSLNVGGFNSQLPGLGGLASNGSVGALPPSFAPAQQQLPRSLPQPSLGGAQPPTGGLNLNAPLAAGGEGGALAPMGGAPELPSVSISSALGVGGFGAQPCIETLMTASQEVVAPPDAVQDKIGFILNNMSQANVYNKSEELQELLQDHAGSIQWFAHYLVVKRIALELNFHSLYIAMLDTLSMSVLYNAIKASTLQNARVLLSSPKIRSSSSERSLLKNLGSWLGQITLGRNKPLLMIDIDLKELIYDGYERGMLIAVVPFVAKVLDACANSKVFMPPNPWVMALMELLMELYHVTNLKLNLKFEIEVLAKTLKVELADIKPTTKLVNRTQDRTQTCDFANRAGSVSASLGGASLGSASFGNLSGPLPPAASSSFAGDGTSVTDSLSLRQGFGQMQPPPPPPLPGQPAPPAGFGGLEKGNAMLALAQQQAQQQAAQAQQQAQQQAQSQLGVGGAPSSLGAQLGGAAGERGGAGGAGLGELEQTVIPNLASYVVLSPGLQLFAQQPQLKRVVPLALDRAIREIISPVVERSVTISCVTTRELMLKDFAMEPDEMRMRKGAQLMVQNLAGSLALVTCKEPLRVACSNHMRNLLLQTGVDSQLMEQVVQVCSSENLELGCTLIEKAATEKAVRDIEEALAPAFAIRRKHREQTGLPYYDMSIFTSGRYPASLPEALRPKPGGLLPAQRRVYEDFGRIPRTAAAIMASGGGPPGGAGASVPQPPGAGGGQQLGQPGFGGQQQQAQLVAQGLLGQQQQMGGADAISFNRLGPQLPGQQQIPTSPQRDASQGLTGLQPGGGAGQAQLPLQMGGVSQQLTGFGSTGSSLFGQGQAAQQGQQQQVLAAMKAQQQQQGQPTAEMLAGQQILSSAQAIERLNVVMAKLDMHAQQLVNGLSSINQLPVEHELHQLLRQVSTVALCSVSRDEVALAMAQKVFNRLYEQVAVAGALGRLYTQINVQLISRIHSVCKKVGRFVSDMLIYAEDDRKLNQEIVLSLLHASILHMGELSAHLAKHMDGGRNGNCVQFCIWLVRCTLLEEQCVTPTDCAELLAAFTHLAQGGGGAPPEGLLRLLDDVRAMLSMGGGGAKKPAAVARRVQPDIDRDDPEQLRIREQAQPLWAEWLTIFDQPNQNDKAYSTYLTSLHTAGWLRASEQGDRFLRALCCLAIGAATADGGLTQIAGGATKVGFNFAPLDALSKLVLLMIKFVPGDSTPQVEQGAKTLAQLGLLKRVLATLVRLIVEQYRAAHLEQYPQGFNQRVYLRLIGSWLFDLNAPDPALDPIQPQILLAFSAAFLAVRPAVLPGFAFAWLELVSHRMFMPKLLLTKGQKGWPLLKQLLVAHFKFLYPFLSAAELSSPVRVLYRGALRILLVLLHDFPQFLCEYHFAFCDAIPPSCIQMRNLILSAFPREMRLPDPFTPNLKVDLLPEISQPPRIPCDFRAALKGSGMLSDVEGFLKTRGPASTLAELRTRIEAAEDAQQVELINSLVLHVGTHGIATLAQAQASGLAASAPMELFGTLMAELSAEARYLFLNAIANQLRYPNNHTHYFSCVLLTLFSEAADERAQEQITRVLVERLIVHRPHPWGLLITFIELIKNPRFHFWSKNFTRCAPEIERLFESVARSCMAPSAAGGNSTPGAVGGGGAGEEQA